MHDPLKMGDEMTFHIFRSILSFGSLSLVKEMEFLVIDAIRHTMPDYGMCQWCRGILGDPKRKFKFPQKRMKKVKNIVN